ncbi:uncharacterized protein LOC141761513 isoform X2 [Sebastes fasciatus]|uniref:uncharacterized protein LOC141761513 isoform X2 n=1 Tax=Sebastes fasciatus TaxID=394691 RepID=UPI003D9EEB91
METDPRRPLSSLHLLVPPLRLMSACMWQVARERNVDQYDKVAEFIMLVTEMVPELLNYKQKTQLILGLRARLILEFLKRMDQVDFKFIQDHLNSFQERTTNQMHEEDQDGEVEISKSAFVELVQTLLRDQSEKEKFFKEVFPVQYGACFDTTLQILVWEFCYRLEEFLPVPSFSEIFFMVDDSSLDYQYEQFVSEPEDLKRILQHQQKRQKLTKSAFTFTSDTILSTLASKQTSVASEDHVDPKMDGGGGDGKQDTVKSRGRNQEMAEQKTLKQENSWSAEDICEDDEETDDSSIETDPNPQLHEYGLSPLSSSPCSEEAGEGGDGETAGEAAIQPPRCSVEGVKEHPNLRINKSEDSIRANENICLECGKSYSSRFYLKCHHTVHSSVRAFKCPHCDKAFKMKKDMKRHLLIHTNPNGLSLACSLCEKKFRNRDSLRGHLRRHSGERPFACSYCDKRFHRKPTLKEHVRTHTGERPYACTLCDKTFIQSYMLTEHIRRHKKEKPYLCSTCGMSFCSSGGLLVHSRTHSGERPHPCDLCEKSFATSTRLTDHRRFHTGERPYSCSRCDKSFHCSSGLKKHMRTHTGEKPYKCITCHKTFSEKSNMRVHLKVHMNI